MDKKLRRRMLQGRVEPEGRLDLHGMNRAEAAAAVERFIQSASKAGKRLVLVITGKGQGAPSRLDGHRQPGGVLRNQARSQLSGPPLAALILDFDSAHPRHGGSGAFYVYLKRRS